MNLFWNDVATHEQKNLRQLQTDQDLTDVTLDTKDGLKRQRKNRTDRIFNITQAKQFRHEGMRYSCDQCDYKVSQHSLFRLHQRAKHEGVRYNCNQCDYKD